MVHIKLKNYAKEMSLDVYMCLLACLRDFKPLLALNSRNIVRSVGDFFPRSQQYLSLEGSKKH